MNSFHTKTPQNAATIVAPCQTYTLSFVPTTPGNWLYHCHFAFHADENASLVGSPRDSTEAAHQEHTGEMPRHSMRGLVIGIRVAPGPGYKEPAATDAREIRLFVQKSPLRLAAMAPAIGFSLQGDDKAPARDSVALPGPILELRRGKPVRIIVRNNLEEPTSVHWHGLEIESFPDGVPHWSGLGSRIYSQVAPGDSFVAAFTPPRAGTFPYHSHLNDRHHILSGIRVVRQAKISDSWSSPRTKGFPGSWNGSVKAALKAAKPFRGAVHRHDPRRFHPRPDSAFGSGTQRRSAYVLRAIVPRPNAVHS